VRSTEIEFWALSNLEQTPAASNTANRERYRLFSKWPSPTSALARRLAGEANAARGLPLLWLFGGDPPHDKLTSAFDDWSTRLLANFDGLGPEMKAVPVQHAGHLWTAIAIETTRLPFVIMHSKKREVPWWEAGEVRSATRSQLLRLLVPASRLPVFEIIEAEFLFYQNIDPSNSRRNPYRWALDSTIFLVPNPGDRVVINAPRCSASACFPGQGPRTRSAELNFSSDSRSSRVRVIDQALVSESVGSFFLQAYGLSGEGDLPTDQPAELVLEFAITGHEQNAVISLPIPTAPTRESNQLGRWRL